MISWVRMMIECHYASSRLERYLDTDPSAPLRAEERARVAAHLAVCERCARESDAHRVLRAALRRWGQHRGPDAAAVRRLTDLVRTIATDERPS